MSPPSFDMEILPPLSPFAPEGKQPEGPSPSNRFAENWRKNVEVKKGAAKRERKRVLEQLPQLRSLKKPGMQPMKKSTKRFKRKKKRNESVEYNHDIQQKRMQPRREKQVTYISFQIPISNQNS